MSIASSIPTQALLRILSYLCLGAALPLTLSGCVSAYVQSVGGETAQVFDRIYLTDLNTAWQASLEALKNNRLDISNREAGFIQTKWMENTNEKNLIDSFGSSDNYLKAQFRFRIHVAKGFYNGRASIKVRVQKEQLVQRDVLDGWRTTSTDSIEEKSLLYRIARIIYIKTKMNELEDEKAKKALKIIDAPQASDNPDTPPPPDPTAE